MMLLMNSCRTFALLGIAAVLAACSGKPAGLDSTLDWDEPPAAVEKQLEGILRSLPDQNQTYSLHRYVMSPRISPLPAVAELQKRHRMLLDGGVPELTGAAREQEIAQLAATREKIPGMTVRELLHWHFQGRLADARARLAIVQQFGQANPVKVVQVVPEVASAEGDAPASTNQNHAFLLFTLQNGSAYDLKVKALYADPYAFGSRLGIECWHSRKAPDLVIPAGATSVERFSCRTAYGMEAAVAFLNESLGDVNWVVEMRDGDLVTPGTTTAVHFDKVEAREIGVQIELMEGWLAKMAKM
jgi:hypothetical protein